MTTLEEKLSDISQQIKKGLVPPRIMARELLSWHGAARRGSNVNLQIRYALKKYGLETQPDFETAFIYGLIKFVAVGSIEEREAETITYRIDGLESANRKPVSVKPDSELKEAITIMMTKCYSQLPVMTTDREVKGIISWKSIGSRLALSKKCAKVSECMDPASIISADSSLFEAIGIIVDHDYVLVQNQDKTISGIVTASDLSKQFKDLAEPFLLIGECESLLRRLISDKFGEDELRNVRDPNDPSRIVTGVADLTFGEYVRLIEEPARWSKLNLSIDRCEFIKRLDRIREIRNDIMHFDPQGLEQEALEDLREFVRFLQELRRIGAL